MTPDQAQQLAMAAGLRYSTDDEPGYRRVRRGKGFSFHRPDGSLVERAERERLGALVIPPAWTDVWVCMDPTGHLQATGRDGQGRKVYLYSETWEEIRESVKYDKLAHFAAALPDLRRQVDGDLRRRGFPKEKVVALVVAVMDETLVRIGNEEYAATSGARGLTTLDDDHVEAGAVRVEFAFTGKSGSQRRIELSDRRLARHIGRLQELPGQRLFEYENGDGSRANIGSGDVNDYLDRHAGGGISAKDFRTWGGTVTVARHLAVDPPAEGRRDREAMVLDAVDLAAERLGNTRAVCRASYLHPAVPDSYHSGDLHDTWRMTRRAGQLDRAERTVAKLVG